MRQNIYKDRLIAYSLLFMGGDEQKDYNYGNRGMALTSIPASGYSEKAELIQSRDPILI
jgi:hypothetical protein